MALRAPPYWPRAWELFFAPLIDQWAAQYALPRDVVYGVIAQESMFNSGAYRAEPQLDPPDASYGLSQVLYRTAQGEGYTGVAGGLFDPETNLRYGLSYLKRMFGRFPRYQAIAAYNGGPGTVRADGTVRNPDYPAQIELNAAWFRQQWAAPVAVTPPSGPGFDYIGQVTVASEATIPAWLVLGLVGAAAVKVVQRKRT